VQRHIAAGVRVIIPEIIYYELRRELLRLGKTRALQSPAKFAHATPDRYLPLNTSAMDLAAELWSQARQRGTPTAHPQALDIDVILAAQTLSAGLNPRDFVVATSNLGHLSQFVPVDLWENIS
jgi:predicted nucleic acid-binding protein